MAGGAIAGTEPVGNGAPSHLNGIQESVAEGEGANLDRSALARQMSKRRSSRMPGDERPVVANVVPEVQPSIAEDGRDPGDGLPGTDESEGATDIDSGESDQPEADALSDELGAEGEDAGDNETELDPDMKRIQDLPPAVRDQVEAIIERKVGKQVAKLKVAEEQLTVARQEQERASTAERNAKLELNRVKAEGVIPSRTANQPLADYMDNNRLQQLEDTSWEFKTFLMSNPNGGEYRWGNGKDEAIVIRKEDVPVELARVERDLSRNIPQRREWLRQRDQFSQAAATEFPQLLQDDHPFTVDVNAIITSFPEVKLLPSYKYVAAWAALGRAYSGLYGGGQLVDKFQEALDQAKAKKAGKTAEIKSKPIEGAKIASSAITTDKIASSGLKSQNPEQPPRASIPSRRPTAAPASQVKRNVVPDDQRGRATPAQMRSRISGRFS